MPGGMNLIVAVDRDWSIGNDGRLLVRIPADQQLFMRETTGKTVIMGRKTLESLPGGLPLAKRENIVLSKDESFRVKGASVARTVEEALELVKDKNPRDVFVIGGESIYRQFLPYCQTAHVTWIDYRYDADTRFPNLDEEPGWRLAQESEEQTYFDLCYYFRRYERI